MAALRPGGGYYQENPAKLEDERRPQFSLSVAETVGFLLYSPDNATNCLRPRYPEPYINQKPRPYILQVQVRGSALVEA